jgi:hypothetical protein
MNQKMMTLEIMNKYLKLNPIRIKERLMIARQQVLLGLILNNFSVRNKMLPFIDKG